MVLKSISELNTRITFQSPTVSTDAGGAQTTSYSNIGTTPTVWANVVFDHGQEGTQNGSFVSLQGATVTIRYRSDILSTYQVSMAGELWKIVSPPENVQNLNRWTVFRIERVKGTL